MDFEKWWTVNCWNYSNIEKSVIKDIWEEGYKCCRWEEVE